MKLWVLIFTSLCLIFSLSSTGLKACPPTEKSKGETKEPPKKPKSKKTSRQTKKQVEAASTESAITGPSIKLKSSKSKSRKAASSGVSAPVKKSKKLRKPSLPKKATKPAPEPDYQF